LLGGIGSDIVNCTGSGGKCNTFWVFVASDVDTLPRQALRSSSNAWADSASFESPAASASRPRRKSRDL